MAHAEINRKVDLLGIAACVGAPDRRCALGPPKVQQLMLAQGYLHDEAVMRWVAMLEAEGDRSQLAAVAHLAGLVSEQVQLSLQDARFVVALGGDHSCAVGTWSGVAAHLKTSAKADAPGGLGLIWIDAHMDSHTLESSPSGRVHGMPVAALLGEGAQDLVDVAYAGAKLLPQHLCLIGVRSFETAESALLESKGVTVFTMDDVRRLGFAEVLRQAQALVSDGTAAYGVSVDLDGLDPLDAPGVGSPVVGGVAAAELLLGLQHLAVDPAFVALEIAELNPVNDVRDKTAGLVLNLIDVVRGGRGVE